MRLMLFRDLQELLYTTLKKDGGISHPRLDYSVFVRQVQGKKLIDATFKRRDRKGGYDVVIQAREAELEVDPANDCLVVHMRYGEACHEGGTYVSFLNREERVPLPEMLFSKYQPRPRDMTWKQLHEARAGLVQNIADIDHELEEAAAGRLTAHTPENLPKHVKALKARQQWHRQEMQQIDTEYQMRPALSLGCLCFVLIGCPVGIWFSRSDYLSAFITCFLPIVFVYYPLTLCTTNFAKDNFFHPALTVWSADLVVVLVSLVLYAKLLRN
jgi:lipopolysaccharide export system permease protein